MLIQAPNIFVQEMQAIKYVNISISIGPCNTVPIWQEGTIMIIVVAIDKILIVILFFKGTSLISKRVIKRIQGKRWCSSLTKVCIHLINQLIILIDFPEHKSLEISFDYMWQLRILEGTKLESHHLEEGYYQLLQSWLKSLSPPDSDFNHAYIITLVMNPPGGMIQAFGPFKFLSCYTSQKTYVQLNQYNQLVDEMIINFS